MEDECHRNNNLNLKVVRVSRMSKRMLKSAILDCFPKQCKIRETVFRNSPMSERILRGCYIITNCPKQYNSEKR